MTTNNKEVNTMKVLTVDRHFKQVVGDVIAQTAGVFGYAARSGRSRLIRIPSVPSGEITGETIAQWVEAVVGLVKQEERNGWFVLPFRITHRDHKVKFMVSVPRTSPVGKVLASLSKEQRMALYDASASICQYGNQPFHRLVRNVPVRVIDEGCVSSKPQDFVEQLKRKKPMDWITNFFATLKEKVSVPFGDGQAYVAPTSSLWELAPEVVHHMGRDQLTAVKVIGWLAGMPFVFFKGVLVKLTEEEWAEKCQAAGVSTDFGGIIANTHAIKNKIRLKLDSEELTFHIGYHSDNRNVEGKTQIAGNQVIRRSINLEDRRRYFRAVTELMKGIATAVAESNIRGLVSLLSGVAKVVEGTPFNGVILQLIARGLPVGFISQPGNAHIHPVVYDNKVYFAQPANPDAPDTYWKFPVKRNGTVGWFLWRHMNLWERAVISLNAVFRNMILKRIGRPKVQFSSRTLPKCSWRFGILQVGLTKAQARKLGVEVGDTIVMVRSPKAEGFPALTLKVVSTEEPCLSIDPILYALFNQGDFDGDTVAIYRNDGIIECEHSLIDVLTVLFEKEDDGFVDKIMGCFSGAVSESYQFPKEIDSLHPMAGALYAMFLSKHCRGAYDNFATRFAKANRSEYSHQRSFWNHITQKAINEKKGTELAESRELGKALKAEGIELGTLDDIHFFLNGNLGNYLNARFGEGVRNPHPISTTILTKFDALNFEHMVENNKAYYSQFEIKATEYFDALVVELSKSDPELVKSIFRHVDDKGKAQRWLDKKTGKEGIVLLSGVFYQLLNPPRDSRESMAVRFNKLVDAVNELAGDNRERALNAWRILYSIALTEPFKRWLLTNVVDEEVDLVVCNVVEHIAKECGFEPVSVEFEDMDDESE